MSDDRLPAQTSRGHVTRETSLAWAAGLFEGEGSFLLTPWGTGRRVRLQIDMTDLDVLEAMQRSIGGSIFGPYVEKQPMKNGQPRKPFWLWRVDGVAAIEATKGMWPWLGERRRERARELGIIVEGLVPLDLVACPSCGRL